MSKPASPFLQDRLAAQRTEEKRSRRSDYGSRRSEYDHATVTTDTGRVSSKASHSRYDSVQGLGVREVDKRLDKLQNLNFDLKMELHHLREKAARFQEECDRLGRSAARAERLAEENAALVGLNDSLVKDLEKRDEAVKEAVTIICDLEDKVHALERQAARYKADPARTPRTKARTEKSRLDLRLKEVETDVILQDRESDRYLTPHSLANTPRRVPSFLEQRQPSTNALRSVYLKSARDLHAVKSYATLMTRRDSMSESEPDTLKSPSLSVLSESSFPSIYNLKKVHRSRGEESESDEEDVRTVQDESTPCEVYGELDAQRDNCRISEWIDNSVNANLSSRRSSLNEARHDGDPQGRPIEDHNRLSRLLKEDAVLQAKRMSGGTAIFGASIFPPTPDSASTHMLRPSTSTLAECSNLAANGHRIIETPNVARQRRKNADMLARSNSSTVRSEHHGQRAESRNAGPRKPHQAPIILSVEDDQDDSDSEEGDSSSSIVPDLGEEYPTGGSIITGTPSRFRARHAEPDLVLPYDGQQRTRAERPEGIRRNTGRGYHVETFARPQVGRAKTSPVMPSTPRSNSTYQPGRPSVGSAFRNHELSASDVPPSHGDNAHDRSMQVENRTIPVSSGRLNLAQKLFRRMSEGRNSSLSPSQSRLAAHNSRHGTPGNAIKHESPVHATDKLHGRYDSPAAVESSPSLLSSRRTESRPQMISGRNTNSSIAGGLLSRRAGHE